jgi:hypothetical protein
MPAIQRYDGPAFRLLRRYLKHSSEELGIYILSAEFGLIPHTRQIPFYDQRMTKQRAQELKIKVVGQAQRLFSADPLRQSFSRQLFVNLGQDYFPAFEPAFPLFASGSIVTMTSGTTGKRLAEMHDWLYGTQPELHKSTSTQPDVSTAKLHGIEIKLTKEQVLNVARSAILKLDQRAASFQAWYVPVDNVRVSPKWLVSLLARLPVGAFHSDEARRVLSQLGVEVIRV